MTITIEEIRKNYPQYKDMSDTQLADSLHRKYYPDMEKEKVYEKLNVKHPSVLGSIGKGAAEIGTGAIQGTAQLGHALGGLETALVNKLIGTQFKSPKPDIYEPLGVQRTGAAQVGEFLPSLGLPQARLGALGAKTIGAIPKIGPYLKAALQQALPQAGYAASQEFDEGPQAAGKHALTAGGMMMPFGALGHAVREGSPLLRKLGRGGSVLAGGFLGEQAGEMAGLPAPLSYPLGLLSGYLTHKGFRPQTAARRQVFGYVERGELPKALERLGASERLGLEYLTPAEAFKSPSLGKKQAGVGQTEAASQKLIERAEKRVSSEEKAINNLFEKIYNEKELGPVKEQQYKTLLSKRMPESFVNEQMTNPIVKDAVKRIEKNPAYQKRFENVPRDSMAYWDQVKRVMQKDLEGVALRKGENYQAQIIGDTRRSMVKQMDDIYPSYENARNTSQREIIRENLEDAMDKKDLTGNQFFATVLKSDKKFNKLIKDLSESPEAQQRLKDMRLLFNDLISPPSVRTSTKLEATGMSKARDSIEGAKRELKEAFLGAHDKAAVDLMTSPNWDETLMKILQEGNKSKAMSMFIDALGKASAQAAARESTNQRETR